MANINVKMTVDEFVTKIIGGERDFCRIKLETGIELNNHDGFSLLYSKLSHEPAEHPLLLSHANLSGIQIYRDLSLNYCIARHANFSNSTLAYVSFSHGDLTGASFTHGRQCWVHFEEAKLIGAKFNSVEMHQGWLRGADVENADFFNCRMTRSDLREIKNLDNAHNLEDATFRYVLTNWSNKRIIRKAMDKREKQLFAKGFAPCRG